MALWSLFVEVGDTSFSTQVIAADPKAAIRQFIGTRGLKDVLKSLSKRGWPNTFSIRDVFVLIPMDGLTNMYLCQFGKGGRYVSVVIVRTVSRKQA